MNVLVVIPNRGSISKHLAAYLASSSRTGVSLAMPQLMPVEYSRNTAVKQFLIGGDWTHMLMIDDDNPPITPMNPLDFEELDLDVVGVATPAWQVKAGDIEAGHYPIMHCAFDLDPREDAYREHWPRTGLQEVDAIGTGCIMIARRVFQAMHAEGMVPFERYFDKEGLVTRGSDITFCEKAKELGFKIWSHYDYKCHHFKTLDLNQVLEIMAYRDITHMNNPDINTPTYWNAQWGVREARDYPFHGDIVELCRGLNVLDYGCGRGDLLEKITKVATTAVGIDFSQKAIDIVRERGLKGVCRHSIPQGFKFDLIVATELLEHLDDPKSMLEDFLEHTHRVLYTVPNNCLPPGVEPEHRRVFTEAYVRQITPHLKSCKSIDQYLMVEVEREHAS